MKNSAFLFAFALVATATAPAANISWNTTLTSTNGLGPAGIFYQGLLSSTISGLLPAHQANAIVYAHDVRGNLTPAAPFTGLAGPDITFTSQNYLPSGPFTALDGTSTWSSGNTNLDDVFKQMAWSGAGPNTVTLTGLNPGQTYEVQLAAGDDRNGLGSRTVTYADPLGSSTGPLALGDFPTVYGSFRADAATQDIIVTGSNAGYLGALVLYTVPEPSRGLLLALGVAGVLLRRRRR